MIIDTAAVLNAYDTKTRIQENEYGHLTEAQQRKVAKLWCLLLDYFSKSDGSPIKASSELFQPIKRDWSSLDQNEEFADEDPEEVTRKAWKFTKSGSSGSGWKLGFGSKKSNPSLEMLALDRYVSETVQQYIDRTNGRHMIVAPEDFFPSFKYRDTTTRSPADVFWTIASIKKNPDIYVLKYLHVSGWDAEKAFQAIKGVIEWRATEEVDKLNYFGDLCMGIDEFRLNLITPVGYDRLGYPVLYTQVRKIMPRGNEEFMIRKYFIYSLENIQKITYDARRTTMLYDFTGFSMDNTPFNLVVFMITMGMKQYADNSGVLILMVDSWLFLNFWNLIKPFLDANLSSRIHFVKNVEGVKRYIDEDQIPVASGGTNKYTFKYSPPSQGVNSLMFDSEAREAAENSWRSSVKIFEAATKQWAREQLADDSDKLSEAEDKRDMASTELFEARRELNKYTHALSPIERSNLVDKNGNFDFSQKSQ